MEKVAITAMNLEHVTEACALWYAIPELAVARSFDTPERISAYLRHNPGFSTIALDGTRIVGALMCGHDGRRGSIYHTGVLPEYRGQGIATRMVDRSLACLKDAGITSAFLFTNEKNLPAQAFWKHIGWQYCSWVQYHYRDL